MNAAVDHPQGIDPDRRSGRLAFNAAVANIERGAVLRAKLFALYIIENNLINEMK